MDDDLGSRVERLDQLHHARPVVLQPTASSEDGAAAYFSTVRTEDEVIRPYHFAGPDEGAPPVHAAARRAVVLGRVQPASRGGARGQVIT